MERNHEMISIQIASQTQQNHQTALMGDIMSQLHQDEQNRPPPRGDRVKNGGNGTQDIGNGGNGQTKPSFADFIEVMVMKLRIAFN
jgi:hypothetical protein